MSQTATTRMTGGQAVVAMLAQHGIEWIFGVPGGHTVPMFDALRDQNDVKLMLGRHEQGLVGMADGYSRATGRIGVVTTTSGPGVANMAAAMGSATTDTVSVLGISSTVATDLVGKNRGGLHDLNDSLEIMRPVCRAVRRCHSVEQIPHMISELIDQIVNGRPGGVYCEIPHDLFSSQADCELPPPVVHTPRLPDEAAVEQAVALLSTAQRPLIWAGTGTVLSSAGDILTRLAEKLGAVVTTSALARGIISSDHPNVTRRDPIAGGPVDKVIGQADVVLAVGTMFRQEDTSYWDIEFSGKLIHIDIDPEEIGRTYSADVGLVADARVALESIEQALPSREPANPEWLASAKLAEADALQAWRRARPTEMQAVDALRSAAPRNTIIVCDRCNLGYWAHRHMAAYQPRTFQYPLGYGGIGGSLPQAIGAKLACPDQPVVCVIGDGGFQYTGMDLILAVQQKTPITIVLCNNHCFGAIKAGMQRNFGHSDIGCTLTNPDFQQFAAAYGVPAKRVDNIAQFGDMLAQAIRSESLNLIELTVDLADPLSTIGGMTD
ncbi:MAG: thiamine pyrophosphate-binding protein [Pirellulaceae bacterium]|nr:thiamine pyrophosphate-binding protein [Pirellulaceae bacterium]